MNTRWFTAIVLAGAMSVSSWPAQAGTGSEWGDPQTVGSRYGRSVVLSADGGAAAWIRTDQTDPEALGPVYASTYLGPRKGWRKPVAIPGTAESSAVSLSDDGRAALIETDGAGYGIAERSGGVWSAPASVASGVSLWGGELSGSGEVVAWIDSAEAGERESVLWARSRADDGTWDDPREVGFVGSMATWRPDLMPVMSHNGSTLVWLDENSALRGAVRAADGSWSATGVIKPYTPMPTIFDAVLSASGKRFVWARSGLLTSVRSGLTWSPPDNISLGAAGSLALSPRGSLVAWVTQQDECCQVMVRRWKNGGWIKPETLASVGALSDVLANDTTVAWVKASGASTMLRTATLVKGKWAVSGKIARKLRAPALSLDGSTLAWSAPATERIVSVRRGDS